MFEKGPNAERTNSAGRERTQRASMHGCKHLHTTGHAATADIRSCDDCGVGRSIDGGQTWMTLEEYQRDHCRKAGAMDDEGLTAAPVVTVRIYTQPTIADPEWTVAFEVNHGPTFRKFTDLGILIDYLLGVQNRRLYQLANMPQRNEGNGK